jgi:hypothetical protein
VDGRRGVVRSCGGVSGGSDGVGGSYDFTGLDDEVRACDGEAGGEGGVD